MTFIISTVTERTQIINQFQLIVNSHLRFDIDMGLSAKGKNAFWNENINTLQDRLNSLYIVAEMALTKPI